MSTTLFLNYFAFFGFAIAESAIITTPLDVSKCAGQDVILQWEYDNPTDLLIATWTFSNDTVNGVIIMQGIAPAGPAPPTPAPLPVQFIENGTIKLFNASSINTGIYRFAILYDVEPAVSSEVDIVIHDVPQALTFQEVTTNTFNCSGSSSIPTVIRVTSKDGVSQKTSPYTRNDTSERIECCYDGIAANCSTETFDNVYGTLYCKLVKEADSPPDPCENLDWCVIIPCGWCTALLVIGLSIIIIIIAGGCTLGYWKYKGIYWFKKVKNEEIVIPAKENGGNNSGNETSRETKPPRRTKHDDNQGNGQSIRANALPPIGYSKVSPDANQRSGDPDKNTPNNEANYTPRPQPILPNIR